MRAGKKDLESILRMRHCSRIIKRRTPGRKII